MRIFGLFKVITVISNTVIPSHLCVEVTMSSCCWEKKPQNIAFSALFNLYNQSFLGANS